MNKLFKLLKILIFFLKEATKTVENETKEQKGEFLSMLLGTLGERLLGNMLVEKRIVRAGYENEMDF